MREEKNAWRKRWLLLGQEAGGACGRSGGAGPDIRVDVC